MYQVISVTRDYVNKITNMQLSNVYVCGTNAFKAISEYSNYPIKNNTIAIRNILGFLQYVDLLINEKSLVSIPSKVLRHLFSGDTYRRYLDILDELEIITRVPYSDGSFYKVDATNCQYRIHNKYLLDVPSIIMLPRKQPVKLIKDRKYPKKFENTIRYAECDFQAAITDEYDNYILSGMPVSKFRYRLSRLLALNNERSIKKGRKVDRIYHSFSNLSRISRKHLHIKGMKFHEIDIRNCQPLLLSYLLKVLNMRCDGNYVDDCKAGCLYERFIKDKRDRDIVKPELYSAIYFDFKPHRKIAQEFKQLYPMTYNSLQQLSADRETLASKLQNLEASIFNKLVPERSDFYFTLFDAIYFTDELDRESLERQISDRLISLL
jgi:hypothetical protein